ncbi:GNAT family N-acetyltransferase [Shewanella olleyana]|uniref:GNAT family N-acetyltransferase n=1 Tax=Shewanella olleyana TaxID=135626 RepID=UPI00200E7C1D|nr:GNAT family N-acetyltransferase [Shewanella olleyana]MCL1068530.1 GNAT family N-acetyltransferase [Shewanella olleyana]
MNNANLSIVAFSPEFAKPVSQLVHDCVQSIDHPRYNAAQLNAWSSAPRSKKHWQQRLQRSQSWLLVTDKTTTETQEVVGIINVETHFHSRGYIDSLYVLPSLQRQGLAAKLFHTLESWAQAQNYTSLSVDASYLSKGFFVKQGFKQIQPSYQMTKNQVINGFYMTKELAD